MFYFFFFFCEKQLCGAVIPLPFFFIPFPLSFAKAFFSSSSSRASASLAVSFPSFFQEREKKPFFIFFFLLFRRKNAFPPSSLEEREREKKKKIVRPTLIYSKVKKRACAPFHFPRSMKKKTPRNYSSCLFEETAIHHISSVFHSPLCSFLLPSLPFPFLPMLSPPKLQASAQKDFFPSSLFCCCCNQKLLRQGLLLLVVVVVEKEKKKKRDLSADSSFPTF